MRLAPRPQVQSQTLKRDHGTINLSLHLLSLSQILGTALYNPPESAVLLQR